jgi:hypothetical protein
VLDILREHGHDQGTKRRPDHGAEKEESHILAADVPQVHTYPLLDPEQHWSIDPAPFEIVVLALFFGKDMDDNLAVV